MKWTILFLAILASPVLAAKKEATPAICAEPVKPQLFLSPMGEPFRPTGDDDDPVKRWFDRADRDHDGKLTAIDMMLDADRFFLTLDKNGNGELLPDEVRAYEQNIAPEIRLYQRRPDAAPGGKAEQAKPKNSKQAALPGEGAAGAGRYAFLNIPNPVASADLDVNRAVSRQEFRAAAAERFNTLDAKQDKVLTFAQLPKTPAQLRANAACLERTAARSKDRR